MFRMLRERRKKRGKTSASTTRLLESLLPDQPVDSVSLDDGIHRHVVQRHYGTGDNIGGSISVVGSISHGDSPASDHSHSHSFSHDHGSSFDHSGSYGSDGSGGW